MKKFLAVLLALSMIATLGTAAFAEAGAVRAENAEDQIKVFFDGFAELVPQEDGNEWYVAVTDLDANGRLELIATCITGGNHISLAKFYELSEDFTTAAELETDAAEDGTFTDILADGADTYYDAQTDTYYFMFADDTILGENEFNATKCSISLKDGKVVHKEYAREHSSNFNGITVIEYNDLNGNIITPDEFNAAGSSEFAKCEKSGTNFGWVEAKNVDESFKLEDSYAIFLGEKEPDKGERKPSEDKPIVNPGFLMITKNPTSEHINEGETAWFVAYADNWNSVGWTFVSPNGGQYSAQNFKNIFPGAKISGANGTSLSVGNVTLEMDGWGAFCTFYGNNQTARSNTAYINVATKPVPKPTDPPIIGGMMGGYVSDYLMSSITIQLDNGGSVQVLRDICYITGGDLDYGCRCTVYFNGGYPTRENVTSVRIEGREPVPEVDPVLPEEPPYDDPVVFEPITESMEDA